MRFTSIDPAASPVYNLYAYSNNSPARFFDPDGLWNEGPGKRSSAEDEAYFAENAALRKAFCDALNLWGLFDQTKGAMRDEKSVGDVASAFSEEVSTKDWKTVGTSGFFTYWNTMWGGWASHVVSADQAASFTGANVNAAEWQQGAGLGGLTAGTALLAVPGPGRMIVGLATMGHGCYDASQGKGITANLQVMAGAGLFLSGTRGLPRGDCGPAPTRRAGLVGQIEGRAQKTGTLGHQFNSYTRALEMAESGLYERIYLNRAYSTVTGTRTCPRRLPDVIGVRLTGEIDAIEVLSRSDFRPTVQARNTAAMNQLPVNMRGRIYLYDDPGRHWNYWPGHQRKFK